MPSAPVDTIKDNKLSESNLTTAGDAAEEADSEQSERLSTLFRKYSIEQYFWRNYNNKARIKTLLLIFAVTISAVLLAIVVCIFAFPR